MGLPFVDQDQRSLTKFTKYTATKYTKNTGPVFFCILGRLPSATSKFDFKDRSCMCWFLHIYFHCQNVDEEPHVTGIAKPVPL